VSAPASTSAPPAGAGAKLDREVMLVASVVVLGAIMSILDTTVVNVAINTLARDFHTSLSTIQWVATGYTLALATVIPLTGWAADRFGTKRLYLTSITLFLAGSCSRAQRGARRRSSSSGSCRASAAACSCRPA
jgi:MFS family permease